MYIIGFSAMACGVAAIAASHYQDYKARQELLAKRPDYVTIIYDELFPRMQQMKCEKLYKIEFPHGMRISNSWLWGIVGVVCWIGGFILLQAPLP